MGRQVKWTKLKDREFLHNLYVVQKQSTVEIAKLVGCDPKSVNWSLKKFGIRTRNLSVSHLSNKNVLCLDWEVINGSLLGDASLLRRNRQTDQGSVSFSKVNKNYDHVVLISKLIYGEQASNRIRKHNKEDRFKFTTLMHDEFKLAHKDWYSEKNKIIPKSLEITPITMLHWFLDDGFCIYRPDCNALRIGLCSESFTVEDNLLLIHQLNDKYKLDAVLTKSGTHGAGFGHRIAVPGKSAEKFFNVIGPPPVKSLSYKWKKAGGKQMSNGRVCNGKILWPSC